MVGVTASGAGTEPETHQSHHEIRFEAGGGAQFQDPVDRARGVGLDRDRQHPGVARERLGEPGRDGFGVGGVADPVVQQRHDGASLRPRVGGEVVLGAGVAGPGGRVGQVHTGGLGARLGDVEAGLVTVVAQQGAEHEQGVAAAHRPVGAGEPGEGHRVPPGLGIVHAAGRGGGCTQHHRRHRPGSEPELAKPGLAGELHAEGQQVARVSVQDRRQGVLPGRVGAHQVHDDRVGGRDRPGEGVGVAEGLGGVEQREAAPTGDRVVEVGGGVDETTQRTRVVGDRDDPHGAPSVSRFSGGAAFTRCRGTITGWPALGSVVTQAFTAKFRSI